MYLLDAAMPKAARITVRQSNGNQLKMNATLVVGHEKKFNARVQEAASRFGLHKRGSGCDAPFFNVAEELPLKDLSLMAIDAVVVLLPEGPDDSGKFDAYRDGYKTERKGGVAKLSPTETVYFIPAPPRDGDREAIYKPLLAESMPRVPPHVMMGVFMTSKASSDKPSEMGKTLSSASPFRRLSQTVARFVSRRDSESDATPGDTLKPVAETGCWERCGCLSFVKSS